MDRITVALLRARRRGTLVGAEALSSQLDESALAEGRGLPLSNAAHGQHPSVEDETPQPVNGAQHSSGRSGTLVPASLPRPKAPRPDRITYSRSRVVNISKEHFANHRIAVDQTHRELLDAVRLLRTQILHRMRENDWRTLAVVSPNDDDGKSLIAVNLAVSIAMELNHTALLVDADLRQPSVHSYLGLSQKPGLAHYLVGNAPIETLLVNPGIDRLLVMPAGGAQLNSSELLSSDEMANLVAELKHRYLDRITIFDLPPVLRSSDALAFLPFVDAALLVVGNGVSDRDDLAQAEELLANSTNLIGVTLNLARDEGNRARRRPGLFRRLFAST